MADNILNTYGMWNLARQIYLIENDRKLNLIELANQMNISSVHPYFRSMMKYLQDEGIITVISTIGTSKYIEINHAKLNKLLEQSKIFIEFEEYISKKKLGVYSI